MSPIATPPPLPCAVYTSFAHLRHLIDADSIVSKSAQLFLNIHLTFEELLACILLEECFMCYRTMEVVEHELENWLDLFFSVAGEMSESGVLSAKIS